jgi:hypothetical protein
MIRTLVVSPGQGMRDYLPMTILAEADQDPGWLNTFMALVPWIIIFMFLWAAIFQFLRKDKRANSNLRVMEERITALEKAVAELRSRPPGYGR